MSQSNIILADGRWMGTHGIGRFSHEVLTRLQHTHILTTGPAPLSLQNIFWQPKKLRELKKQYDIFFTPGFNPVLFSPHPFVITVHDLIHLHTTTPQQWLKKLYYEKLLKPSLQQAYKILTVSEYSRQTIIEWTKCDKEKVIVVGNGISSAFTAAGKIRTMNHPYLLHVGNNKPHKNIPRLLQAFAEAKIDAGIQLILTSTLTAELSNTIKNLHLENRIIFSGPLSETELAEYYRGALAVVLPSLQEGFGLPILEAMACGTPVITSNITSMPEIAGTAALLINPSAITEIALGIEKIIHDTQLRDILRLRGFQQIQGFSWDKTASTVQEALVL